VVLPEPSQGLCQRSDAKKRQNSLDFGSDSAFDAARDGTPAASTHYPQSGKKVATLGWINEPQTLTAAVVFVAAFLLTGVFRLMFDPRRASLGPAVIIPIALFVVVGAPNFPVSSTFEQIAILGFAGLVLGAFVELEGFNQWPRRALIIVAPLAGLIWIIARGNDFGLAMGDRNFAVFLVIGVGIAAARASRGKGSAVTAPVLLMLAAAGLSVVSWISGVIALAQITALIGVSVGGFFVWNWPKYRYPPGAALVVGAAAPLAAATGVLILDGRANGASVAILSLIFFSDWLAGFVSLGGGPVARAMRPVMVIVIAGIFIALAAAVGN
jgi:hypothetical protein